MFDKPSQSLIESACMSFRHDFGLIPALAAAPVMVEAEQWLAAWRVGFEPYSSSPTHAGLGSGWPKPNAHVVDAACLAFDPGFRQRPFHEATTIRRGGVSWLQAWRHAFEDQGFKGRTASAGLEDHPQRPVIMEADDPSVFASSALRDIAAERARQVEVEGRSAAHDDNYPSGELARAGACYALHAGVDLGEETPAFWPWDRAWWKPKSARRDLVRAAALIVAEIDRGDRLNGRGVDSGFGALASGVDKP